MPGKLSVCNEGHKVCRVLKMMDHGDAHAKRKHSHPATDGSWERAIRSGEIGPWAIWRVCHSRSLDEKSQGKAQAMSVMLQETYSIPADA